MTLSDQQLQAAMPQGWTGGPQGVTRTFRFSSYAEGVAFALRVALTAEREGHHPDALIIAWKRVDVTYVTHDLGGVTELDLQAAHAVNAFCP